MCSEGLAPSAEPPPTPKSSGVPAPWEEHYDDTYGIPYFWHTETGEAVWEKPSAWHDCGAGDVDALRVAGRSGQKARSKRELEIIVQNGVEYIRLRGADQADNEMIGESTKQTEDVEDDEGDCWGSWGAGGTKVDAKVRSSREIANRAEIDWVQKSTWGGNTTVSGAALQSSQSQSGARASSAGGRRRKVVIWPTLAIRQPRRRGHVSWQYLGPG